jgi:hypothetical protein
MLYGLAGGVGINLLFSILRSKSGTTRLTEISGTFKDKNFFPNYESENPIYQFEDSLNYLNTEKMLGKLIPDEDKTYY